MTKDYFSVFELTPAFDIDSAALEKRYFEAQRKSHPDRLIGKSAEQRQQVILQSILINEAYEALKLPLSRARHLLALEGINVGSEKDSVKPSQALLMEIMQLREALQEADTAEKIEKIAQQNTQYREETVTLLSSAFAQKEYTQAAELTIRLGYLEKISEEIRGRKKGLNT